MLHKPLSPMDKSTFLPLQHTATLIFSVDWGLGGVIALVFGLWRAWVAEVQASAVQLQSETAQKTLLNERFQRSTDMLGSNVLAVRIGGVHALQRLGREHPEEYHLQIMELLCAFVRSPTQPRSTVSSSCIEHGDNAPL